MSKINWGKVAALTALTGGVFQGIISIFPSVETSLAGTIIVAILGGINAALNTAKK